MKKVTSADELKQAIADLEKVAAAQKKDLQDTYFAVSENLKPVNLVKSGVRSVFSGEHNADILNAVIGLGSGLLSRKLLLGKTRGIIGKTFGRALQWGMAGFVSKNAETIKEKAGWLIDKLFKKHHPDTNHSPALKPGLKKTVS
jgi:hypothetical protein